MKILRNPRTLAIVAGDAQKQMTSQNGHSQTHFVLYKILYYMEPHVRYYRCIGKTEFCNTRHHVMTSVNFILSKSMLSLFINTASSIA